MTEKELDFLEWAFKTHAKGRITRVFDVACGGGRHVVGLAQRGYECRGQDFAPERVQIAKATAGREGLQLPYVRRMSHILIMRGVRHRQSAIHLVFDAQR